MGLDARAEAPVLGTRRGRNTRLVRSDCGLTAGYLLWAVYTAYGGIFIVLALVWGILIEGFQPDRYNVLGAAIALAGALVIIFPSRA